VNNYSLTGLAESEVRDIWQFIAEDNEEAADRWVIKIIETFDLLARNPRLGHSRKDLISRPWLFWPVGTYMVIYRIVAEDDIEIIAVTEGSRDLPSYLRKRS
jgi:plasmid stabilization system protein ParE